MSATLKAFKASTIVKISKQSIITTTIEITTRTIEITIQPVYNKIVNNNVYDIQIITFTAYKTPTVYQSTPVTITTLTIDLIITLIILLIVIAPGISVIIVIVTNRLATTTI